MKYVTIFFAILVFTTECTLFNSTDRNFVGTWIVSRQNPRLNGYGTILGESATITKMENTSETYLFDYLGLEFTMTKVNENELVSLGQRIGDGTLHLVFDPTRKTLTEISNDQKINTEFTKLK